ncbi:hypothetical protein EG68_05642 [Paragonimus skrjabini miyazakii]|uniref:Uncharacterized protein n=1 Tax=Paragonimus skrjabini miyazakii TaxID=59628 RepID=A0A8S9YSB7_9TREM|nr:hypothetical protein EG68_05642 [Paragonimus skrjabini miyazakii]
MFRRPKGLMSIPTSKFSENDETSLSELLSDKDPEKQFSSHGLIESQNDMVALKCDEAKVSAIAEALQCVLTQIHEQNKLEDNFVTELNELCSKAKALEAKLASKKSLILNHFQQLVSKLDRET